MLPGALFVGQGEVRVDELQVDAGGPSLLNRLFGILPGYAGAHAFHPTTGPPRRNAISLKLIANPAPFGSER